MTDVHRKTVEEDPAFHAYMDSTHPGWREWDFQKQRMHAKAWNFGRLYGVPGAESTEKPEQK